VPAVQDRMVSDRNRGIGSRGGPDCEAIVCICETCEQILVYDGIARAEVDAWPQLRYPERESLDPSVPEPIRETYQEAARVKRNAPRAFALLIRRAVEAICDDRDVPAGNLASRLRTLSQRGDVPPVLAEMTDVLRLLGNIAAHGSPDSVKVPMTWAIDDFFRAIVQYVYVAPSKLADFKARLEKLTTSEGDARRRACVACGKERAVASGKVCSNGHFVCIECLPMGATSSASRSACPVCSKELH